MYVVSLDAPAPATTAGHLENQHDEVQAVAPDPPVVMSLDADDEGEEELRPESDSPMEV